jgi:hypothetical protein
MSTSTGKVLGNSEIILKEVPHPPLLFYDCSDIFKKNITGGFPSR